MKTVSAIEPDLGEQRVEQAPGLADERLALAVLVRPRRLADEHQVGVRVSHAEDEPASASPEADSRARHAIRGRARRGPPGAPLRIARPSAQLKPQDRRPAFFVSASCGQAGLSFAGQAATAVGADLQLDPHAQNRPVFRMRELERTTTRHSHRLRRPRVGRPRRAWPSRLGARAQPRRSGVARRRAGWSRRGARRRGGRPLRPGRRDRKCGRRHRRPRPGRRAHERRDEPQRPRAGAYRARFGLHPLQTVTGPESSAPGLRGRRSRGRVRSALGAREDAGRARLACRRSRSTPGDERLPRRRLGRLQLPRHARGQRRGGRRRGGDRRSSGGACRRSSRRPSATGSSTRRAARADGAGRARRHGDGRPLSAPRSTPPPRSCLPFSTRSSSAPESWPR